MAGEVERGVAVVDPHALLVDLERPARRGPFQRRRARRHALEDGLDPSRHLARAERLDHVVVGADLQADHAVDLGIARGEEDHRHLGEPPQALAGLETADVRQTDVEDQQIRRLALLQRQRLAGEGHPGGGEAFGLQGV